MDSERFDALVRTLSRETVRSRRGVLRTAAGGLVVGLLGAVRASASTQAQIPPPLCPEWVLVRYPWLCEGNEPNNPNNRDNDDDNDDDNKDNDKKKDTDPDPVQTCSAANCDSGCCAGTTCEVGNYEACGTEGRACINCNRVGGSTFNCTPTTCECRPGRGAACRKG